MQSDNQEAKFNTAYDKDVVVAVRLASIFSRWNWHTTLFAETGVLPIFFFFWGRGDSTKTFKQWLWEKLWELQEFLESDESDEFMDGEMCDILQLCEQMDFDGDDESWQWQSIESTDFLSCESNTQRMPPAETFEGCCESLLAKICNWFPTSPVWFLFLSVPGNRCFFEWSLCSQNFVEE